MSCMEDKSYKCVCCGYSTPHKGHMRMHLYKKRPCPMTENEVELTNDVKEYILANRVYRIPEASPRKSREGKEQHPPSPLPF